MRLAVSGQIWRSVVFDGFDGMAAGVGFQSKTECPPSYRWRPSRAYRMEPGAACVRGRCSRRRDQSRGRDAEDDDAVLCSGHGNTVEPSLVIRALANSLEAIL